ncbi:MAG: DUF2341 domain-containing protein [Bacteroidia bacterium]|nr:DUF2341 domain-containing protein [Bacteroidia bacterium]
MKKKSLPLLLLLQLIYSTGFTQLNTWLYKIPLDVTNNAAISVVNHQIAFNIGTDTMIARGHMNPDGSDIRFATDCSGNNVLNYWIESGINTSNTLIWIKLDSLNALETKTIFMFYGESSATAVSSVNGTFNGPFSSTDSVASGGAGGVGNSQRGFRFSPNQNLLVTSFGKREPNGSTRYVTLFDNNTQSIIAQTQVVGPAGQYSYTDLSNPIWLNQGVQYVLQLFQGAGDGYYFGTSSQIGEHLTYIDMMYCNSCTQNTFPTTTLSNYHYGYPDLWYYTQSQLSPAPTVTLTSPINLVSTYNGNAICHGDSIQLDVIATGGIPNYTYSWSPTPGLNNTTNSIVNAAPDSSTLYTVMATDGCVFTSTLDILVPVIPQPVIDITPSQTQTCEGESISLTANGAISYSWDQGVLDGIPFTPTQTSTYTVYGTDINGCTGSDNITIPVYPIPVAGISSSSTTICSGDQITLSGTGCDIYNWDQGISDNTPFSPAQSSTYTVIGYSNYGCADTAMIYITVNPLPTPGITASNNSVCIGNSVTLEGTGCQNYVWDQGVTNTVPFTPSQTATYTVTGIDSNGCSDTTSITIFVDPLPLVSIQASDSIVCENDWVTLTGIGDAAAYNWDNGISDGVPFQATTSTTTYTVTGITSFGCTSSVVINLQVSTLPVVSFSMNPSQLCIYNPPFTLNSGLPAGGNYSGIGITNNLLDPAVAGMGVIPITYVYTDSNNCSNYDTSSVMIDLCAGLNESNSNQLLIYPNPSTGQFTLIDQNLSINQIEIYNSIGEKVLSLPVYKNEKIQFYLPIPGLYFIKSNENVISKLIVQN